MYPEEYLNYEDNNGVYWYSSPFDALNNWSAHAVAVWGREFKTVEHAYHFAKFMDEHPDIADKIAAAPSPWAAMQIDRAHQSKNRKDWLEVRVAIMKELCMLKYAQNEDVREILKRTGTRTIYENSPRDAFWGLGQNKDGQNMMGKIWMEIRDTQ